MSIVTFIYMYFNVERNIDFPDAQSLQSISRAELTLLGVNDLLGKPGTSSCYLILTRTVVKIIKINVSVEKFLVR